MYHITDLTDFFYFSSGVAKVHVTKDAVSIHCFLYFFAEICLYVTPRFFNQAKVLVLKSTIVYKRYISNERDC